VAAVLARRADAGAFRAAFFAAPLRWGCADLPDAFFAALTGRAAGFAALFFLAVFRAAAGFAFAAGLAGSGAGAAFAAAHRFLTAATIRARPSALRTRFGAAAAGVAGALTRGVPILRRKSAICCSISLSFAW
jgi:hypothetical protein